MSRAKMVSWLAATVGTALLAASGNVAAADPQESTHVDSLVAAASGNTVAVTGEAGFVDVPALVGEDPTGDATISGTAGGDLPLGDDLTSATVAKPDPFTDTVTFTLGVANQPPAVNGTPETIYYNWEIAVDGGDTLLLQALRSGQWAKPGAGTVFRILRFDSEADSYRSVADVTGTMADGVVEWQIPMSEINAKPGSVIAQLGIVSTVGGSGLLWWPNLGGDQMFVEVDDVTVPGPDVQLGIAPAGTPPETVELTHTATVQDAGTFTGNLPTPTSPGEYVVVAKACNGEGNCGLASASVTI